MRKRVMVVEDDEFIGEVIAASLDEQGYSVDVFHSGLNIWKYLEHNKPSLILLDLALPNEDGITICRKLRNDPTTAKIPIVIVSAMSQPRTVSAAMDAGANDFIRKPFDIEDLVTAAKTYIRGRSRSVRDSVPMMQPSVSPAV